MWGAGLIDVQYTDDPGSVTSGRSATTGDHPPTSGQWSRGAFRFNRSPAFQITSILGKDMVRNGNLEQNQGWSRYGAPRANEQSRDQAHGGDHALKVVGNAGAGVRQYLRSAMPGQRYRLSGWLHVSTGAARLMVYDGKKLKYGTTVSRPRWSKVTMTFSTVDGSTPYIGAQAVGDDARFYLDDVSCQPVEKVKRSSRLVLGWVCTASGSPGTWVEVYVQGEP